MARIDGMVRAIALATERAIEANLAPGLKVDHIVQNRQGIVHTESTTDGLPDAILGGNIYDGRIAVDMERNSNWLDRALVLLAHTPSGACAGHRTEHGRMGAQSSVRRRASRR